LASAVAAGVTILFALLPALQATRLSLTECLTRPHRCRRPQFDAATPPRHLPGGCITRARSRCCEHSSGTASPSGHGSGHGHRSTSSQCGPGRGDKTLLASDTRGTCRRSSIGSGGGDEQEPSLLATHRGCRSSNRPASCCRHYTFVSPEYFPILNIPIVHGRGLLERGITDRGHPSPSSAPPAHGRFGLVRNR
jgi:hypothetical protein